MKHVPGQTSLLDLCLEPVVPRNKPRTSQKAARVAVNTSEADRRKIYELMDSRSISGLTREEAHLMLGIKIQSVCFRWRELVKLKLIYDTGWTRPTTSGATAGVFCALRKVGG